MGSIRVARREIASLRREKTIVLALVIQLFLAGFSSFLLVGLVSLYDPGSISGGGIEVGVAGESADDLVRAVEDEGPWRLEPYDDEERAREAFQRGRLDAVLVASPEGDGVVRVEALVPDESVRSTVIVAQVRELLSGYERVRRAELADRLERQPVPVPDLPDAIPTFSFTYTVLVPLLVFLPGFISGSTAADAITEETDAGTLDLLRVTPLSPTAIVDGKLLAMILLGTVQAGAWLALLWLNGTVLVHPLSILALAAAVTTVLVATGGGVAILLGDRQSTQLVYSLGVIAFFVGATLLPESPPNTVAKLAVGSATPVTFAHVAGALALAVAVYAVGRRRSAGALGD